MRLGSATLVTSLTLLAACYDFSLPDDRGTGGAAASGSGGAGASVGGADAAGGGPSGSGAQGSYPPPCDEYDCSGCVICTLTFFQVESADCEAYDGCVVGCSGDTVCESSCQGSHPLGSFGRATLDAECSEVCAGPVPCGP